MRRAGFEAQATCLDYVARAPIATPREALPRPDNRRRAPSIGASRAVAPV